MSMGRVRNFAALAIVGAATSACTYLPELNERREVEVREVIAVVECEIIGAVRELGPLFTRGKWDVKSDLDLSLVNVIGADGRAAWVIPTSNTLTPSASVGHKTTSTAHLNFVTQIVEAEKRVSKECRGLDPSGTGLGLASWMVSSFRSVNAKDNGGLSYTKIFELTTVAGVRFGFAFTNTPIGGEVGGGGTRIGTHQLTVSVSPHIDPPKPQVVEVAIVRDDTRPDPAAASRPKEQKSGNVGDNRGLSRRDQILTNPIGTNMLNRQAPIRLAPGTSLTPLR